MYFHKIPYYHNLGSIIITLSPSCLSFLTTSSSSVPFQIHVWHKPIPFSYVYIEYSFRKDITQKLQKEKGILDHIFQWKETPDHMGKTLTVKNYDETMLASGKAGETLELRLAGAKGQANAIAARQKKS